MALTLNDFRTETRANVKSSIIPSARIDLWVNLAQEEIWRSLDPEFGKETATFSTVASTRLYRFEASIGKILSVVNQTNNYRMKQLGEIDIERIDPDIDDLGAPFYYTLFGMEYVNNQPSAASVVTVVSSDGTDITQTVQIVGISSGVETEEILTLNGIVNVIGTVSFTNLLKISKSATTAGRITVTTNAGAVTNIVIPARRIYVEYQPIRLWPIPNAVITVLVRYIRQPIPMRNAGDVPDLPQLWHGTMFNLVLAYAHDFIYEFDRANVLRQLVTSQLVELKAKDSQKRDYAHVIRKRIVTKGLGRLPPTYPLD